jgi:hypothetical protein
MFECHITCMQHDSVKATEVAKQLHWKTSEIARDPVLGNDTYFYLTSHSDKLATMYERMEKVVAQLTWVNVKVIREKIEVIIHDVRF